MLSLRGRALASGGAVLVVRAVLPMGAAPSPPGGLRITFLGSLLSFLAAGAGLFPSGADVAASCCGTLGLAAPHPGRPSESCSPREDPCARQGEAGSARLLP